MPLSTLRHFFRAYSQQTIKQRLKGSSKVEIDAAAADIQCRHMQQLLVRGDNIVMIHRDGTSLV